ncbi:MAG: hypothetical protein MUF19_03555 [Candidatus Pacebacteria bacterium]|nr:hypothetical protein [Candidatus Paceibacterota bacterium]
MITNSPFIQLFMVILAVAILLLYIQPTIESIRATQDDIAIYQNELDRVTEVNDILRTHTNTINTLPLSDVQALERYIPSTIDEIAVMRDLQLLVNEIGITLTALEYGGPAAAAEADGSAVTETESNNEELVSTTFSLGVETSYAGLKALLRALEVNNYQFTVAGADIVPGETGLLSVSLDLVTYALRAPSSGTDVSVMP